MSSVLSFVIFFIYGFISLFRYFFILFVPSVVMDGFFLYVFISLFLYFCRYIFLSIVLSIVSSW